MVPELAVYSTTVPLQASSPTFKPIDNMVFQKKVVYLILVMTSANVNLFLKITPVFDSRGNSPWSYVEDLHLPQQSYVATPPCQN